MEPMYSTNHDQGINLKQALKHFFGNLVYSCEVGVMDSLRAACSPHVVCTLYKLVNHTVRCTLLIMNTIMGESHEQLYTV